MKLELLSCSFKLQFSEVNTGLGTNLLFFTVMPQFILFIISNTCADL